MLPADTAISQSWPPGRVRPENMHATALFCCAPHWGRHARLLASFETAVEELLHRQALDNEHQASSCARISPCTPPAQNACGGVGGLQGMLPAAASAFQSVKAVLGSRPLHQKKPFTRRMNRGAHKKGGFTAASRASDATRLERRKPRPGRGQPSSAASRAPPGPRRVRPDQMGGNAPGNLARVLAAS